MLDLLRENDDSRLRSIAPGSPPAPSPESLPAQAGSRNDRIPAGSYDHF
jgi:hypothetical protein